jgi:hypothetical protein
MRNELLEQTRDKIKELEHNIENKTYSSWGSDEYAQKTLESLKKKERVLSQDSKEIDAGKEDLKNVWAKLQKIEAKEKCLRVQFLDWLSDKLLDWSNRAHVMANKIDSPCMIEVAPRKKEESKHAKESKELARMKELLANECATNNRLRKEQSEMTANMLNEFKDLQKEMTK